MPIPQSGELGQPKYIDFYVNIRNPEQGTSRTSETAVLEVNIR